MIENREHDGKIAMMIKLIEVDFKIPKEMESTLIQALRDLLTTLEPNKRQHGPKS